MNYKNIEIFKKWLEKELKAEVFNFDAYLDDLTNQNDCNGVKEVGGKFYGEYELSSTETKSGRPELISFEVYFKFLKGEEVVDCEDDYEEVETTITF